jgi:hypothetical protein
MEAIGYHVEDSGIVCIKCSYNPMYNLATSAVYKEDYPDGYTCDDCGNPFASEDYIPEGESNA